jgi:hypothetical protein
MKYSLFQRVLKWAYTRYVLIPHLEHALKQPTDPKISMAMLERQYNELH